MLSDQSNFLGIFFGNHFSVKSIIIGLGWNIQGKAIALIRVLPGEYQIICQLESSVLRYTWGMCQVLPVFYYFGDDWLNYTWTVLKRFPMILLPTNLISIFFHSVFFQCSLQWQHISTCYYLIHSEYTR